LSGEEHGLAAGRKVPALVRYSGGSAAHRITVTDTGFRRTLALDGSPQSSMYLDDPYETDFEYPAYFHLALAVVPDAARTLAIGLGGGTVVKRMWRDYPEMRIDAVELDPEVVRIARDLFALPDDPRIRVFIGDGADFVCSATDVYDVVVVDAFDGDQMPRQVATAEFMAGLRARLAPTGAVVYNAIGALGDRSGPVGELYRTLAGVWDRVWVFAVDEGVHAAGGNVIMLASDTTLSTGALLERIADRVGGRVTVPAFHLFGENLYEGPL
jgi:spermidine synthase